MIDYTGKLFRLPFDLFEGMLGNVFGPGFEALEKRAQSRSFYDGDIKASEEEFNAAFHRLNLKHWESMRVLGEKTRAGVRAVGHVALKEIRDGIALSDLFE